MKKQQQQKIRKKIEIIYYFNTFHTQQQKQINYTHKKAIQTR